MECLEKMKTATYFLCVLSIFSIQGCQTLKEGAEIGYAVRENGRQQERVIDASRMQLVSVAVKPSGILISASELEYSTVWSYPKIERVQIADRTLSRLIAAGGVFFTAGLAYFDKDFERMWGDERVEVRVVETWLDRNKGERTPASGTVRENIINGFFNVRVVRLRANGVVLTEVFQGPVQFRSGTGLLDFSKLDLKLRPSEEVKLQVIIEQPSVLKPLPNSFNFNASLASQVVSIRGDESKDSRSTASNDSTVSGNAAKRAKCRRIGLTEESADFDLCIRSIR